MKEELAEILVVTSRFLDYPDQQFYQECSSLDTYLNTFITAEEMQKEMYQRLKPLFSLGLKDLQELYVETFDYKEKTGLYLTAQELGDSRRRGDALIRLQKLIADLGFEKVGIELTDYIPMLMELLAVAPENEEIRHLKRRLAYAIHRIFSQVSSSNPYFQIFDSLMTHVFEAPSSEEIARLLNEREEADLDELPYPMLYR
ncbi:nitrate reductase molybdenum cofactor assembly chaperone [Cytobacillus solani]|uniref:Nitrate reductase n=1 Tax=Cytobacillus solani TaxID=1637975 RepID=A0A0Q3QPZ0_9BACI|nr:nitrate reductase molybdenum cofactor assembly chaperone [Cytobacillus solani]KOP82754.1 nitrate reductase [Bacillus sp. FJAT-21945]KQL19774.1 nitrate reductase [Cytobacillus solani]USK53006.1 nitrate reductase molybdenum cofactor assembly chaperone [Cytobacillus solani]